jgi:hypothetical protein
VDALNTGWTDFAYITDDEYRQSVKNPRQSSHRRVV